MRIRTLLASALAATLLTGLAACGSGGADAGSTASAEASKPLRVMADVIPHAELIKEAESLGLLGGGCQLVCVRDGVLSQKEIRL